MAAKNEINVMTPWIVSRLRESERLVEIVGTHPDEDVVQTYEMIAMPGAVYPFVIVRFMSGQYRNGSEGRRILVKARYDVYVVDQVNSYGSLEEPSNLILEQLDLSHLTRLPERDGHMIGCKPVALYQNERFENEERTLYLGNTFELHCRAVY